MTSGNIIYHCSELPHEIEYGNLEKNEQYVYSQILLECLEEYSSLNEPEHVRNFKKFREEEKNNQHAVCCRLFERLEIQDLCSNCEITEEEKIQMWNELTCICEKTTPVDVG